jgi:hypothetical protein
MRINYIYVINALLSFWSIRAGRPAALPNSNETLKFVLNSGPRLQPTGLL